MAKKQIETKSIEEMRAALIGLPSTKEVPAASYDVERARSYGLLNNGTLEIKAVEIAELTVQNRGSVYDGHQSTSRSSVKRTVMYIGGVNTQNDFLIVGRDIDEKFENLVQPARLSLQDLIGYKTLEVIPQKR